MKRLMSTAAVIATVAFTGAAVAPTAAEAVSISGAKRQMRKGGVPGAGETRWA
jgi:hypothetical protein